LRQVADLCRPRSRRGTSVRRTAAPMVIVTLGIPLALQTDRIVLAHRSSLEALAHYAVAIQLYAPLWAVIATAGSVLWPIFARRRASSTQRGVNGPLLGFTLVGCVGAVSLVAVGPWVAHLAAGSHLGVDRGLFMAFGVLLLIQAAQLPIGMFLMTDAGLRFQAICVACMVPVSLALSWWAAGKWGATGPVLGSIIAVLICQLLPGLRRARASRPADFTPLTDDLVLA
jgi:O-antigen/teichoic acid export membrane protein